MAHLDLPAAERTVTELIHLLMLLSQQKGRHDSEFLWHCRRPALCRKISTLMMTSAASGAMQIVCLLPRRRGMTDSLSATA